MSDGNLQIRTFRNHVSQFLHLGVAFQHIYRQDEPVFLHEMEHGHHFVTVQRDPACRQSQAVGRNLDGFESFSYQLLDLCQESRFAELTEAAHQKAIGVTGLYIHQIIVLYAVDIFLCDHGGTDLRVVHVGEEHFCRVSPVRHKRRKHLPDFTHEKRFASREGTDGQSVDFGILPEP